jgi:membrane protease YdiL (CAAX protease family)
MAVGLVLTLSYLRWLPFPWRQPAVALIAISLVLLSREPLSAIGFRRPVPVMMTMAWALVALAISVGVISLVIEPFLSRLAGTPADYSVYGALQGNLPATLQLIGLAWLSAAIGEEIIFRGFLIHEVAAAFGGGAAASAGGVTVGATLFGLSHYGQGPVGVIVTGLSGLMMGAVFLASRRNIWSIILAHGLIDTLGVTTLYMGWY